MAVLFYLDTGIELAGEIDELGTGAGVKAPLVADSDRARQRVQAAASPRISEATEIYLRPASRAAATAAPTLITLGAPSRRMSIGKLTPAMTSMSSLFIRLMARFDGVPPNRSVRMMTPLPRSTRWIAAAMSARRASMSSSASMQMPSTASCGPTTCSIAVMNSAASRPWVTNTNPIIHSPELLTRPRPGEDLRRYHSASRRGRGGGYSPECRLHATVLPSPPLPRPTGDAPQCNQTPRSDTFCRRPNSGESGRGEEPRCCPSPGPSPGP